MCVHATARAYVLLGLTQRVSLNGADIIMLQEPVMMNYIDPLFITNNISMFVADQNDKSTPLHLACTQGALEVVKMMLSSFGQVEDFINLTDGACQTPLHRLASLLPPTPIV